MCCGSSPSQWESPGCGNVKQLMPLHLQPIRFPRCRLVSQGKPGRMIYTHSGNLSSGKLRVRKLMRFGWQCGNLSPFGIEQRGPGKEKANTAHRENSKTWEQEINARWKWKRISISDQSLSQITFFFFWEREALFLPCSLRQTLSIFSLYSCSISMQVPQGCLD